MPIALKRISGAIVVAGAFVRGGYTANTRLGSEVEVEVKGREGGRRKGEMKGGEGSAVVEIPLDRREYPRDARGTVYTCAGRGPYGWHADSGRTCVPEGKQTRGWIPREVISSQISGCEVVQ